MQVSDSVIADLAADLGVPRAVVKAVAAVESSGASNLPVHAVTPRGLPVGGFPVVQLEGHVFWSQLSKAGLDPSKILADPATRDIVDQTGKPIGAKLLADILYPSLDMSKMRKPLEEWDQLAAARAIHDAAADMSASWGAFQIMGFNHKPCGHLDIRSFVCEAQTLDGQARLFAKFLKSSPPIVKALRALDFKAFARLYNGRKAVANGYHLKLQREYERASR